jgi:hypothetical protein
MYLAGRGRNLPATNMSTNQDAGARVKDSRPQESGLPPSTPRARRKTIIINDLIFLAFFACSAVNVFNHWRTTVRRDTTPELKKGQYVSWGFFLLWGRLPQVELRLKFG